MAIFFTPPTAPLVPTSVNPSHPGSLLMRHYAPWQAGLNVWLMPGGVLTTVEPEFESDAVRVFHGGHIHPVDEAEAALLVAAGYAVVDLDAPAATSASDYGSGDYGSGLYGGTP